MDGTAFVIGLWPSVEEFAADCGISVGHARIWKHRRSVPAEYWSRVEREAKRRGIEGATASRLAAAFEAMRTAAPAAGTPATSAA